MPFAIAQLLRRSSLLILVLLLVVVVPCSHLVRRSNPSLTGLTSITIAAAGEDLVPGGCS
jgi:hypothetical protein